MSNDPMELVIGASTAARDSEAAAKHAEAAGTALAEGDREMAIAELRRAVAANPSDGALACRLAYELDLSGEEDEAQGLYEEICDTPPAPINALSILAVSYEDKGECGKAERCLRQVLETNPNHERARLYMKDVSASRDMIVEDEPDRDAMKRRALLDTPVTDFELSVRARTCLKKMNIRTLGDLLKITEAELMSYKNFGEASLLEIKKMLSQRNLRLGQGMEDAHRAARRQVLESLKGSGKEAMLNKSVSDMQLSVRARKALQLLGIPTIGDLVSHTEAELMGVKNFGATSLVEVKQRLVDYGLSLRELDS